MVENNEDGFPGAQGQDGERSMEPAALRSDYL